MRPSVPAHRVAIALLLLLLAGATMAGAPGPSASASGARANASTAATLIVTASPTPQASPTAQTDPCSARVIGIERIDPYHKDAKTEIKDGATLKVAPLYELVKLKLKLDINVPAGEEMSFTAHARVNIGTNAKPDWIQVGLRNPTFNPNAIPGKKTGAQDVQFEFSLPSNVDLPNREPKSLVGETVVLTLRWQCKVGGGYLASFTLHAQKPQLGLIAGTVTEGANMPLWQCKLMLDPPALGMGRVTTGTDGRYEFENVLAGQYIVTATGVCGGKQTHVEQSKPATVEADKTTTVDFVLKPK